jgi:hypothetical protein
MRTERSWLARRSRGMRALGALLLVGLALASTAAAKDFHPGDLRVCNAKTCIAITNQAALDAFERLYYSGPPPRRVSPPRLGAPYFRLLYRNGYVTGIVASARLDRFLSYGVNLGQFPRGHWYRVPPRAARELRAITADLTPFRLTHAAIAKNR